MQKNLIFVWGKNFKTGHPTIDEQHKSLVDMVNTLSEKLLNNDINDDELYPLFTKLVAYADHHFKTEEQLMSEKQVSKKHISDHIKNHRLFVKEVSLMFSSATDGVFDIAKIKNLRDFLVHWLAFHILDEDQKLVKQLDLIDEGKSPKKAYKSVFGKKDKKSQPLTEALKGMMNILEIRNQELTNLKNNLEIKVQERTSELNQANKILEELSMTDQLTKLANRRFALKSLKLFWEDTITKDHQLSILMIDCDYFKEVNDTHGHTAGDMVLSSVAKALTQSIRTDDIVCRMGGDEFLIICPNTDMQGCIQVGKNIHNTISQLNVCINDSIVWKASVSVGIGNSSGLETIDELLKEADANLYVAKKDGRNCVRWSKE